MLIVFSVLIPAFPLSVGSVVTSGVTFEAHVVLRLCHASEKTAESLSSESFQPLTPSSAETKNDQELYYLSPPQAACRSYSGTALVFTQTDVSEEVILHRPAPERRYRICTALRPRGQPSSPHLSPAMRTSD